MEKLTAAGGAAEAANKKSGRQSFVPAASLTDKTAIMFGVPYYTERDRGLIPAWRNEADPGFWPGWLGFDAVKAAPAVTQPFLMVHSEAAAIPKGAHRFYARLTSPRSELWLDNVSQFDFYDQAVPVTRASDAAAVHFRKTLLNDTEKQCRDGLASAGVREFFAALEALDIPRFLRVWADDGVQDMPFAPGTFPKRLEGKAAIERQYGPLPSAFSGMRFPVRRPVTTNEPGLVIAEYDGSIGLKSGGRYDNRYVGTFQFNTEGKLAHFTEYFDPLTLIRGFPGAAEAATPDDERIRRAVESLGAATDSRDWTAVRALFAEDVDLDYTSVAGGAPARVKADALVAGWTQGLDRYQSTRHNFSGARVTIQGDQATAAFSGQATHVKTNGERWSCGGDYTYRFVRTPQGWKANAATFAMQWEQGIR